MLLTDSIALQVFFAAVRADLQRSTLSSAASTCMDICVFEWTPDRVS